MIKSLSSQHVPIIEARRVTFQMPFTDHASVITRRLQCLCHRPLTAIKTIERRNTVDVAVFPGEDRSAARRADGIDRETIFEAHAFLGETINVRCLVDLAAIRADRVRRMIV